MPQFLAGPGQGLPIPANLYPSELYNAPYDFSTNEVTLAPGDTLPIPAGQWLIGLNGYAVLQFLDPITGVWRGFSSARSQPSFIRSDGFNVRVANLTGCVAAARVDNGGTGYSQATATAVASAGSATFQPIVGGQVSVISVGTTGASYTTAPLVFIPAPPNPGVPATAAATISAGTVASVSMTNVGAGYTSIPTAVILPNPNDPNVGTITQAVVALGTVGSGKITACLVTNNGIPQAGAVAPTITPAGTAGTAATISAIMMSTATSLSIIGAGVGYTNAEVQSVGGRPAAGAYTNPAIELTDYIPRKASVGPTLTATSLTATGTIYDGGLFMAAPSGVVVTNGLQTTGASVQFVLGSVNDTVILQQL